MKIIFSQSNFTRRDEFLIITKIIKEKNKIYVRKEIASPQTINFLKKLYENQSLIKKNLIEAYMPKIIERNNYYLDFEYLNFPSFEYLIEEALIIGDYKKAESLYLSFLDFIDKQPVINYHFHKNKKFNSIFLELINVNINDYKSLKYGLLDLNLDNLLYDEKNKKIFIIDWEWFFDFPIPKDFLIFRSLFYLSAHLQSIIKTHCSQNFPCVEIIKDFYTPKIFWKHYSFSLKQIKLFLVMENNFQHYALKIPPKFNENIFLDNLLEKTKINEIPISSNNQLNQQDFSYLKKEIKNLTNKLHKIQSSKTYKIWQAYCRLRDKIFKRKSA